MISAKIEKAINNQVNREAYSAYLYLSMSAYFASRNLEGFAHWMRLQAQEELGHAMKLFDYLLERDGSPALAVIEAPSATWESPLAVCENVFEHEQSVTKSINDLVTLARTENDHATETFLRWFVQEQVEEEASAQALVEKIKLVGDFGGALFILDQELAKRQLAAE